MSEPCEKCGGRGAVLVDLNGVNLGEGFHLFMTAGDPLGQAPRRNEDGSTYYEWVCPACDGSGHATEDRR